MKPFQGDETIINDHRCGVRAQKRACTLADPGVLRLREALRLSRERLEVFQKKADFESEVVASLGGTSKSESHAFNPRDIGFS